MNDKSYLVLNILKIIMWWAYTFQNLSEENEVSRQDILKFVPKFHISNWFEAR
jgi:hypothetical protein